MMLILININDININDKNGNYPLLKACCRNNIEIIKLLLNYADEKKYYFICQ